MQREQPRRARRRPDPGQLSYRSSGSTHGCPVERRGNSRGRRFLNLRVSSLPLRGLAPRIQVLNDIGTTSKQPWKSAELGPWAEGPRIEPNRAVSRRRRRQTAADPKSCASSRRSSRSLTRSTITQTSSAKSPGRVRSYRRFSSSLLRKLRRLPIPNDLGEHICKFMLSSIVQLDGQWCCVERPIVPYFSNF